jgi:hypothetical protein
MSLRRDRLVLTWFSLVALAASSTASDTPPDPMATLQRPDGQRARGRLTGDAKGGFRFEATEPGQTVPLEPGTLVLFEGTGPAPTDGSPPFRLELGLGQRISGRLSRVDDQFVRFEESSAGRSIVVPRGGVRAVVQRLGEVQIVEDGFESIDGARWMLIGDPEIVDEPRLTGAHSVRIPAGGTSLTTRLSEPFEAGRLEVAFHDGGVVAPGQQWFVDLLFRGRSGSETVRAVLGWAEESLSVESPGGPALAVQRLARKPGWHRLSLRFGPDQTEISVDGNDLAHGKGPGGPLVEIRLASYSAVKTQAPPGLAGHLDDLRLVRFADPVAGQEVDPSQDEARLVRGDQIFGTIRSADGERVTMSVDNQEVSLLWSEVSGLDFRRVALPGRPVDGLLVRAEWLATPGDDLRNLDQIEGALSAVSDASFVIETPYAGTLTIARDRLRRLRVLGQGRRIVIDAAAHHLGNEIVSAPLPLDPPQPEGGVLERSFELADIPSGPAFLTFDAVQMVGEASGLPFSDLVKKGEIRTNVLVNGKKIDYLNHYIASKNETPERIRLPVPSGLLRAGTNRIRLEQVGKANDPDYLDDLGVLEIAVEFAAKGTDPRAPENP